MKYIVRGSVNQGYCICSKLRSCPVNSVSNCPNLRSCGKHG